MGRKWLLFEENKHTVCMWNEIKAFNTVTEGQRRKGEKQRRFSKAKSSKLYFKMYTRIGRRFWTGLRGNVYRSSSALVKPFDLQ